MLLLPLCFLCFISTTIGASVCNVLDKSIPIFSFTSFDENSPIDVIPPAKLQDNYIRIVENEEFGGVAGLFWWSEQQRVADGFIAEFTVGVNGTSDGFAFVVQNDKTYNVLGGTGSNLGFRDALDKYVAVAFDLCPDREEITSDCSRETVAIVKQGVLDNDEEPITISYANLTQSIKTQKEITVRVVYTANNGYLSVELKYGTGNYQLVLNDLVNSVEDLWGSRYAWFGFTASTSWDNTVDIDVKSFEILQQPSDNAIKEKLPRETSFGDFLILTVLILDTCQQVVDTLPIKLTQNGGIESNINATLTLQLPENLTAFERRQAERIIPGEIIGFGSKLGEIRLQFEMPANVIGDWDLEVLVQGVPSEGLPLLGAISTIPPQPPLLPAWGLGLLLTIVLLLLGSMMYALRRLYRYRQKLKENEENINAGKEKTYLDELDRQVDYKINPLMGSLEDMKKRLEENRAELARLQAGKGIMEDEKYTIEQLQAQNEELRKEMNRLKVEEQKNDAENANFAAQNKTNIDKKQQKVEFSQTQS